MIAISFLVLAILVRDIPAKPELDAAVRLYEHGDFLQVSRLLTHRCSEQENCGDARVLLAKSYLKLRRWDDAIHEMEKAVRQAPANGLYHLWLGRAYGEKAEHVFAISAYGLARKVLKEFTVSVNLAPEDTDSRFDLLEFYLQAPGMLGGGADKAEAEAEAIAKIDKRRGYAAGARILEHAKRWQEAEDELKRATLLFPDAPEAFGDLAAYYIRRENYAQAEDAANKALSLRSAYPAAILIRAVAQIRQQKDLVAAEKSLRALATGPLQDDDPPFEEVYYWLGMTILAQGDKIGARQAFLTALQFNPEHSGAKSALAQMRSTS